MQAFVHIGTSKTGTTTIQNFLYANRQLLVRQGYCFPLCITDHAVNHFPEYNHNPLAFLDFKSIYAALRQEISAAGCPNTIFSAEALQTCGAERIREFQALLGELGFGQITIIIYLRDAASHYASAFSQLIRKGAVKSDEPQAVYNYAPLHDADERRSSDHKTTLQCWSALFGAENLRVRLFTPETLQDGDVLRDFLHVLGLSWDAAFTVPARANESLNLLEMALLKSLNRWVTGPVYSPAYIKYHIYQLIRKHLALAGDPALKFALPREVCRDIDQLFADDYEWVREHYFPERKRLFAAQDLEHYHENYELKVMRSEYWDQLAMLILDLELQLQAAKKQIALLQAGSRPPGAGQ